MTIDSRLPAIVEALRKRGDAYAPLVDALTEDCTNDSWVCRQNDTCVCGGTQRWMRKWSKLPDGALVGPVWKALLRVKRSIARVFKPSEYELFDKLLLAVQTSVWADDSNAHVVDSLETWLGLKTESEVKG